MGQEDCAGGWRLVASCLQAGREALEMWLPEEGWLWGRGEECINGSIASLAEEGIVPHVVIQEPKR